MPSQETGTSVQSTLVLIKPDGVMMGVTQQIIDRYRAAGLTVHKDLGIQLLQAEAEAFYAEHKGKFFFAGLVLAMISGPIVAIELRGEDAVARVRALNGATDPSKSEPGTIRHDFRSAGGPFNTVHGSDSVESARREMAIVFGS